MRFRPVKREKGAGPGDGGDALSLRIPAAKMLVTFKSIYIHESHRYPFPGAVGISFQRAARPPRLEHVNTFERY